MRVIRKRFKSYKTKFDLFLEKDSRLRRNKKNAIALFLAVGFLSSCQTAPQKFYEHSSGQWKAKIQVFKKEKPSMPLVAKIRSENPEKLRMDITTLSGFYAGSVLVIKDQFKALLPRQRKFYQGKSQISVMKKVLSVPINPQWLNQILFETPSENWDCKRGRHSLLKSCIDSASGMSVEWKERARDQRNISLKLNDHRVELFLSEFSLQIEKPEEAFRLKAPSSFKKVFLR